MNEPLALLEGVEVGWSVGRTDLRVERFALARGEFVAVVGPSGGGKSTLVATLAGVVVPRAGRATMLGHDLRQLSRHQRDRLRGVSMGLVFQSLHLLPYLDVVASIALPCQLHRERRARLGREVRTAARELACELGLGGVLDRPVGSLSLGQQQRVAVARALLGQPLLVLADEPTAALDGAMRERFLEVLLSQAASTGAAVVIATHDLAVAERCERVVRVAAGRIEVAE